MNTETFIPAGTYAVLVNDLARILAHDHDHPGERRAAIAATLHSADLFLPALVIALADAEPCPFSGIVTADEVRWTLGEAGIWCESLSSFPAAA